MVHSHARPHRTCMIRGGTVRFADRVVLDGVDLVVGPTDRIAVIGDNGAGKSTVLNVLADRVRLAAGERLVELPGGCALAEQRPEFAVGATVANALDWLLADIRRIEAQIQHLGDQLASAPEPEHPVLLDLLAATMASFEARSGYQLDQRVEAALDQLSLGDLDRARPVESLSGGERARLALAAALSSEAELLLLDEPTNDLDDAGVAWLEGRVAQHRGALVVVTHDRAFLDRFATDIVEVDGGGLRRHGHGYAGYLTARKAERRRLLAEHDAWREELARSRALVASNAFRADGIPRKQERSSFGHGAFRARSSDHGATSRIRQAKERVARLEADPALKPAEPLRFNPAFERHDGDEPGPLLVVDALEVLDGDRLLVAGPNGAGKTTLLRMLAGEVESSAGAVWQRPGVRVAWLRQDLAASCGGTLLDSFAEAVGAFGEDAAELLLSLGLFAPSDLDQALATMSVGQRRRFEIAVAVSEPSDVLMLDEPTNHLAPDLVEQLETAVLGYPGAVVTVTHDRRWRERATLAGGVRRLQVLPGGRVVNDQGVQLVSQGSVSHPAIGS